MGTSTSLILGIESSCDETAASVVADGRVVRSNVVASQHDLHERYGGVVPELASRAHVEQVLPVIQSALDKAGVTAAQLDAVAVGNRPGLIGSLIVGVTAAKAFAWATGKPLIGVDHVQAHLHAPLLEDSPAANNASQPEGCNTDATALGLVVSGGHTSLYRIDRQGSLQRLGGTIDDAAGEAFDKAAVILGLPYPGGPNLDRVAEQGDPQAYALPRSLLDRDSLDFSFSGLKTSLLYAVRGKPIGRGKAMHFERSADDLTETQRADFAASFRAAVVDALMIKLKRALKQEQNAGNQPTTILLGGGVTANQELRRQSAAFAQKHELAVRVPPMAYCMDNAAMIAGAAHRRCLAEQFDDLALEVASTSRLMTR